MSGERNAPADGAPVYTWVTTHERDFLTDVGKDFPKFLQELAERGPRDKPRDWGRAASASAFCGYIDREVQESPSVAFRRFYAECEGTGLYGALSRFAGGSDRAGRSVDAGARGNAKAASRLINEIADYCDHVCPLAKPESDKHAVSRSGLVGEGSLGSARREFDIRAEVGRSIKSRTVWDARGFFERYLDELGEPSNPGILTKLAWAQYDCVARAKGLTPLHGDGFAARCRGLMGELDDSGEKKPRTARYFSKKNRAGLDSVLETLGGFAAGKETVGKSAEEIEGDFESVRETLLVAIAKDTYYNWQRSGRKRPSENGGKPAGISIPGKYLEYHRDEETQRRRERRRERAALIEASFRTYRDLISGRRSWGSYIDMDGARRDDCKILVCHDDETGVELYLASPKALPESERDGGAAPNARAVYALSYQDVVDENGMPGLGPDAAPSADPRIKAHLRSIKDETGALPAGRTDNKAYMRQVIREYEMQVEASRGRKPAMDAMYLTRRPVT